MADPDIRTRITRIVGERLAEQIINVLEEESVTPCTDPDCVRRRRHSRLDRHLWRHACGAPRTRGLLGWRCFNCGQSSWRRIHRTRKDTP